MSLARAGGVALAVLSVAGAGCSLSSPAERGSSTVVVDGADEVRFETLRGLVAAGGVRTIDQLVPRLPRGFRSRYVLMYESRSIQSASLKAPRVLMFTHDARFVAAFDGGSGSGGSETLETMEFDERRGALRLREIDFGDDPPAVSEDNPARCLACHGQDPRPLWDTYPTWPGAYGEQEHAQPEGDEAAGLAAFLAFRQGRPRYLALLGVESLSARPVSREAAAYEGRDRPSLNSEFGIHLQELDYVAIARRVTLHARFRPFRYALLASLDPRCLEVEAFVPDRVRARFARSFDAFLRETEQANDAQAVAKRERTHSHADAQVRPQTETLTPFRYLIEEGLGLSTRGWTLALERDTYDFTTARDSRRILEREVLDGVVRGDPEVAELRLAPDRHDTYCTRLRKKSLASLAGL